MTPEARLRASLTEVRGRFDAGADDWRHSLLRTFREYCKAIGIERELIDPIQRMLFETDEAIFRGRRKAAGRQVNATSTLRDVVPLTVAAAAVTVLKPLYPTVRDAAKAVGTASGIDWRKVNSFRDELGKRGKTSKTTKKGYHECVVTLKTWPADEILQRISGIGIFGK
jgi:hypothetical protein